MNIHDLWKQLRIFRASESEGKSTTFLRVCFAVPGVKSSTATTRNCGLSLLAAWVSTQLSQDLKCILGSLFNIIPQYNANDNVLTHWYQDLAHGPAGSLDIDSTEPVLAKHVGRTVLHPLERNYTTTGQVPEKKS